MAGYAAGSTGWIARVRRSIARFARRTGLRPPLGTVQAAYKPATKPASGLTPSMMPRLSQSRPALPAPPSTFVREYAVPLDRRAEPTHVILRLSIPGFPEAMPQVVYGEHAISAEGNMVIALSPSLAAESHDLGHSWSTHRVAIELPPRGCFTTSLGTRLVCTHTAKTASGGALIYRFDAEWKQTSAPFAVESPWHGSASIGESHGTIMFAEYPDNAAKYRDDAAPVLDARVWRSRDDGVSWSVVKTVPPSLIRHLHTLAPEPGIAGRWWLSSGDRAEEVFVWRSDDDGDSWIDVTEKAPEVPLHRHFTQYARAVQRMTDLVFHDGFMIWGADDWLGYTEKNANDRPAAGSRVYRARTDGPWKVEELGFCGKPVRNIVDVGPAFLLTTEAKYLERGARPDVFLLFKDDLNKVHHIAQIDNYAKGGTGFTYSFASRAASGGTFFSHRGAYDAFRADARILKWELTFT